jgi:hypothetical protein
MIRVIHSRTALGEELYEERGHRNVPETPGVPDAEFTTFRGFPCSIGIAFDARNY